VLANETRSLEAETGVDNKLKFLRKALSSLLDSPKNYPLRRFSTSHLPIHFLYCSEFWKLFKLVDKMNHDKFSSVEMETSFKDFITYHTSLSLVLIKNIVYIPIVCIFRPTDVSQIWAS
jgi:hypothetical protein